MEPLTRYLGVKEVFATPMTAQAAGEILNRPIDTTNADAEGNGYLVIYKDGYRNWSPKAQFEEANRPATGMTFGMAIEAMRKGHKVARKGWNGKDMWIVLMPSLYLPPFNTQEPGAKVNDRTAKHIGKDTALDSQPYIAMWTAAKQWQPGWLASQADILADDWAVCVDMKKACNTPTVAP